MKKGRRPKVALRKRQPLRGPEEWVIQLVDPRTGRTLEGEGVEGIPVEGRVRRKRRWTNEFFLGVQNGIARLAVHEDLTHDARRVFLFMASRVEWDNYIGISQKEIAEGLGISRPRVSRAVKLLVETRFISPKVRNRDADQFQAVKKGRAVVYELSGDVVWKGTIDQQLKFQRRWQADVKRWAEQKGDPSSGGDSEVE